MKGGETDNTLAMNTAVPADTSPQGVCAPFMHVHATAAAGSRAAHDRPNNFDAKRKLMGDNTLY